MGFLLGENSLPLEKSTYTILASFYAYKPFENFLVVVGGVVGVGCWPKVILVLSLALKLNNIKPTL